MNQPHRSPENPEIKEHTVNLWTPLHMKIDENYKIINFNPIFQFCSWIVFGAAYIVVSFFKLFYGMRVKGRKNLKALKGQGALSVCNHCHMLDTPLIAHSLFPKKVYFASYQRNFEVPGLRWIIRFLRAFPIPNGVLGFKRIEKPVAEAIHRGSFVQIFPEGDMWHLNQEMKRFKPGVFYLSVVNNLPILPMAMEIKPRRLLGKLSKEFVKITLKIGEPIFPGDHINLDSDNPRAEASILGEVVKERIQSLMI